LKYSHTIFLLTVLAAIPSIAAATSYDVASTTVTRAQAYGPDTITFYGFNPLRWIPSIKASVTVSAAPTPPPSVLPPSSSGTKGFVGPLNTVKEIDAALKSIELQSIPSARRSVEPAASDLDALVNDAPDNAAKNAVQDPAVHTAGIAFRHLLDTDRPLLVEIADDIPKAAGGTEAEKQSLLKRVSEASNTIDGLLTSYPFFVRAPDKFFVAQDFESSYEANCGGLLAGSSSTVVTLTLTSRTDSKTTKLDDVTVQCLSRIAVTGGFIFSSLPQRTFTAIGANSALPSPAPGAPTPPPATIQQSVSSSVRPVPFAFVNVSMSQRCLEHCWFASFGAGVNSGSASGSTTVDFATGATYSLFRYLFLSVGAHLGQVNYLANGYSPNGPIAAGATVPTLTRSQIGAFLGITFGSH